MSSIGSFEVVVPLGKVVEHLGGKALLEEVHYLGAGLEESSPTFCSLCAP